MNLFTIIKILIPTSYIDPVVGPFWKWYITVLALVKEKTAHVPGSNRRKIKNKIIFIDSHDRLRNLAKQNIKSLCLYKTKAP